MSQDRRHPYRPFDRSLIEPFLRDRDLLSVELIQAGKSNTNYKLTLSDGERYLLRLRSRGDGAREQYVMDLVRDLVPVPREIARGEGWSIFTFLKGTLLQAVPDRVGVAAEALARIASVRFPSGGQIEADGTVSPFPFDGVAGFVTGELARDEVWSHLGRRRVDAIRQILEREAGRLAEMERRCCLVHGDFNPTNILINHGAVSGVLDWEFSLAGTSYMDIGNLLRHADPAYHGAIRAGLEAGGMALPDDWKTRATLVDIASQIEFLTSGRSASFKRQCVARIDHFIAQFAPGG